MADYWKSLPRKFCDTCKCWFADNKASIDFHEKGKRHQENVKKRINELQKKGLKEFKAQKELENEMQKIEEAALQAFKKDLESNPELSRTLLAAAAKNKEEDEQETIAEVDAIPEKEENVSHVSPSEEVPAEKEWFEAVSEDGHAYYWNVNTSASQWEPPEEGFVSLEEQKQQQTTDEDSAQNVEEKDQKDESNETTEVEKEAVASSASEEEEEAIPNDAIGPLPKPTPYGQWVTVTPVVKEDPVDLQLPAKSENEVEMHIPITNEDSRIKIKEKIIGHLELDDSFSAENSFFKKRKNIGGAKRNVRQRLKDDD